MLDKVACKCYERRIDETDVSRCIWHRLTVVCASFKAGRDGVHRLVKHAVGKGALVVGVYIELRNRKIPDADPRVIGKFGADRRRYGRQGHKQRVHLDVA